MKSPKERAKELVAQMTLAEKCAQMKYDAPAIERLGVPATTGGTRPSTGWRALGRPRCSPRPLAWRPALTRT